jgi:hypothetical protein
LLLCSDLLLLDLYFFHPTNSQYLQSPLKPDPTTPYCMADCARFDRYAVVLLQALANFIQCQLGVSDSAVKSV